MIEPNATALVVIDVQQGLFAKEIHVFHEKELLENINLLMDAFHSKKLPVIFVRHTNESIMKEGTQEWSLHPDLEVYTDDVMINKHNSSAFKEKEFKLQLDKAGVNRLVIAGLVTHGCVKAACLDGLELGYEVLLASDAHSSYNREAEKLIIEWNGKLSKEGVEVMKTRDIVDELNNMNF